MPLYLGCAVLSPTGATRNPVQIRLESGACPLWFPMKIASFMPTKTPRAIRPLWALSAMAHKDVAFTCYIL